MKKYILVLCCTLLTACAYNSTTITAEGDVDCTTTVDRPTDVNTNPYISIPVKGNTVSPSGNTVPLTP